MKIQFRQKDMAVTARLRAHVERRLTLALARFGDRIVRVTVRCSEDGGADQGTEKRCEIDVGLRPRSVRVEDRDADLRTAVDRATSRLSRSVDRALERETEWEQPRRPAGDRST